MPPPRKIDLMPDQFRDWLRKTLAEKGFADLDAITAELNSKLEGEGIELSLSMASVGRYSKLLKDQREAFSMAEMLLADMDIEAEGDLHRTLMQMIAVSAMQMMQAVREEDGNLEPKDLMQLAKMLKDLMGSAGIREKLLDDERSRIAKKAREAAAEEVTKASNELGLSSDTVEAIKGRILGVGA